MMMADRSHGSKPLVAPVMLFRLGIHVAYPPLSAPEGKLLIAVIGALPLVAAAPTVYTSTTYVVWKRGHRHRVFGIEKRLR
jgi:hypothetical protein